MHIHHIFESTRVVHCARLQAGTKVTCRDAFLFYGGNSSRVPYTTVLAMYRFVSALCLKRLHPVLTALATFFLLAGSLSTPGALAQVPGFATTPKGKTACEVINQADAQAALGEAVAPGEATPGLSGSSTCVYTGTDLPSKVGINLYRSNNGAEWQYRMMLEDDKSATALKVLGNEAHVRFDGDNGTIVVKHGSSVVFEIGIQHGVYRADQWIRLKRVSVDSLRTLAEAALRRVDQPK